VGPPDCGKFVHEPELTALRRAVWHEVLRGGIGVQAVAGRREHDPAVVLAPHRRQRCLHQPERCLEVHRDRAAPEFLVDRLDGSAQREPGTVDERVEAPQPLDGCGDRRSAPVARSEIVVRGLDACACRAQLLGSGVDDGAVRAGTVGSHTCVVQHERRAASCEQPCIREPEPAPAPVINTTWPSKRITRRGYPPNPLWGARDGPQHKR
jgi:hypothetical protein